MIRILSSLTLGFTFLTNCLGAIEGVRSTRSYFFPPPKSLYFFRPDLNIYQIPRRAMVNPYYPSYPNYSFPLYGYPVYSYPRISPYAYSPYSEVCVSQGCRGESGYGVYGVVLGPPPTGGVVRANSSDIIFGVQPSRALVFIDGRLIGSAGDFATQRDRYTILDGEHQLRIEYPGYRAFETKLEIVPNRTLHLDIQLEQLQNNP